MNHMNPAQILDVVVKTGQAKAGGTWKKLMLLGILAGAYIAFAGIASNTAAFNLLGEAETYGVGKVLSGTIFTGGLIMVVLAGGELFTGNTLILTAVLDKKIKLFRMIRNWIIVYIANFIGASFIAFLVNQTSLFDNGDGMLGAYTVTMAAGKVSGSFLHYLIAGLLCNWLVCLAVWISFGADSTIGKIFSMFFPIWIFVTSGFEHSIANMYFIPAGIFASADEAYVSLSGLSEDVLSQLTWGGMFLHNLIPVTLGNIIGGALCVGTAYWLSFRKWENDLQDEEKGEKVNE